MTKRTGSVPAIVAGGGLMALALVLDLGRMAWYGRMSAEMTYDDVVYALAGAGRASLLMSSGLRAVVGDFFHNPPHAPVTEALSSVATLLGGPSTARIYLMNALLIAALCLLFMRILVGHRWATVLTGGALLLVSPLGFFLADQYRPDTAYLIVLAATCLAGGSLARSAPSSRRPWIMATGALAGSLLYMKPSFFVLTAMCMAGLGVYVFAALLARHTRLASATRTVALTALTAAAVAVPFMLLFLRGEIDYVRANMLGDNAKAWIMSSGWEATLISAQQARDVLVWMVPLALLAVFACLVIAVVHRAPSRVLRAGALFAVSIASLVPVTLTRSPSVFFGLIPVGLTILGCVVMGYDVLQPEWRSWRSRRPRADRSWRMGLADIVALVLIVFAGFLAPAGYATPKGLQPPLSVNGRILAAAIDHCSADSACDAAYTSLRSIPRILVAPAAEVSQDSMQWEAVLGEWEGLIQRTPFLVEATDLTRLTAEADFVVLLGSAATYVNPQLPVNQVQDSFRSLLSADANWIRLTVPVVGERYELYSRVALARR